LFVFADCVLDDNNDKDKEENSSKDINKKEDVDDNANKYNDDKNE
jgi:hypothetical protein